MRSCCGEPIPSCEAVFDARAARDDLRSLRSKGLSWYSAELIRALADGIDLGGLTVLDIGAGVGGVHLGLLERGAASAVDVDGSSAYLAATRDEAARRGLSDRVEHRLGDVTAMAWSLEPADLVALDRVVCCYGAVDALVSTAASLARRRVGLVYPRDTWWIRAGAAAANPVMFRRSAGYRMRIHRQATVATLMHEAGFERRTARDGRVWRVECWERSAALPA